jgi:hypothetical protein
MNPHSEKRELEKTKRLIQPEIEEDFCVGELLVACEKQRKRLEKQPCTLKPLLEYHVAGANYRDFNSYCWRFEAELRERYERLQKPHRAGSIYTPSQEEGMLILMAELLKDFTPQSRTEIDNFLKKTSPYYKKDVVQFQSKEDKKV